MRTYIVIIFLVVLALVFTGYVTLVKKDTPENEVDQVQNTGPVYYKDLIRLDSPLPGSKISSDVYVRGAARGNWYFEASFPVKIVDAQGATLAEGIAEAQSDWMTTSYVPFIANIQITDVKVPEGASLRIILIKDNPSGLPENDDATSLNVIYSSSETQE